MIGLKMELSNIALIFDQERAVSIESYATKLTENFESGVKIGRNSTPHLTILQFEGYQDLRDEVWDYCKETFQLPLVIEFAGLTVLPSSSGGAWIEISVLKSTALAQIQQDILTRFSNVLIPKNAVGDSYRPHVTVAHLAQPLPSVLVPLEYEPVRANQVEAKIALGVGTNFYPCIGSI